MVEQVIITEQCKKRGWNVGDIVTVKRGFATHCLYPRNIAKPATEDNLQQVKRLKLQEQKAEENQTNHAKVIKNVLTANVIYLTLPVGPTGRPFGAITAKMLANACMTQLRVEIDPKKIKLLNSISELGFCKVPVQLSPTVEAAINIRVTPVYNGTELTG